MPTTSKVVRGWAASVTGVEATGPRVATAPSGGRPLEGGDRRCGVSDRSRRSRQPITAR